MLRKFWIHIAVYVVTSCHVVCYTEGGFRYLKRNVVPFRTTVKCSSDVKDVSSLNQFVRLLSGDGVIGIYRKGKTAHRCFANQTGSGLVDLANLTGGEKFMMGMVFYL